MTYPYLVFGDVEAACIDELKNASEVLAFTGIRVSSDFNGYQTPARWITVSREGGNVVELALDKPRIDFQVLAETRTVAHNIAQVAQAVIFRAIGKKYPTHNVQIADAEVETGIFRVPDKETGSPRYVFSLRLTCVTL